MSDNVKYALGLVLAAFLVAAGWIARTWYDNSVQLKIERVKDEVSLTVATELAKIKIENKTVYNKTVEKTKTDVIYQDCKADTEMMTLTNKVILGK